jgi:hypothetical protein
MNADSAAIADDLHLVHVSENGVLWHCIRLADGSWSEWGQVRFPEGHEIASATCANVGGELHVTVVTINGLIYHDIRHPDGRWQGMGQLPSQPLLGG